MSSLYRYAELSLWLALLSIAFAITSILWNYKESNKASSLVCSEHGQIIERATNSNITHSDGIYYITLLDGRKATYDKSLDERCAIVATKDYEDAGKP